MIVEQMQVVAFFLLGILCFSMQEIGIFFIVMDQTYAIVCSIIILIGIRVTYSYTLRIYNRFYWVGSTDHWRERKGGAGGTTSRPHHQDDARESEMDPTDMVIAAQQTLNAEKNKTGMYVYPIFKAELY